MIKISIIVTTARLGGLDVLVNTLAQQTMSPNEWELILVDEYWKDRRHLLEGVQLPIKHLPPRRITDVYDNSAGFNCALREATGELVTVLTDFVWLYPGYLEAHWSWYQKHPGYSMTSYVDRYVPPLVVLVESRKYWSVFAQDFTNEYANYFFQNSHPEYKERKGGIVGDPLAGGWPWEMPGSMIYLLGDSIPLRVLKELNGFDEAYDSGYGSNDIDIGVRANMLGWKFVLNPRSIVYKLGTPTSSRVLPGVNKQRLRTAAANYQIFLNRVAAIQAAQEAVAVPKGRGAWA